MLRVRVRARARVCVCPSVDDSRWHISLPRRLAYSVKIIPPYYFRIAVNGDSSARRYVRLGLHIQNELVNR